MPQNLKKLIINAEKACRQGCPARAVSLYKTILSQYPEDPETIKVIGEIDFNLTTFSDENLCFDLGNIMARFGRIKAATTCYRRAIEINPSLGKFYVHLASMLNILNRIDEAVFYFRVALEINPDSMVSKHMLAALTGRTPPKPPDHYVKNLFNRFSAYFDTQMQVKLEYRVPGLMIELIDSVLPPGYGFDHGLDLGCGTGLAGEKFRPRCKHLSGVDISPGMIEMATKKSVYDRLHGDEIMVFLDQTKTVYDLFIAADVLVYLGDLLPLFQGVSRCSAQRAVFVLSHELIEGSGYVLLKTGRYAHSKQYVIEKAHGCGFKLSGYRQAGIRLEKGSWVQGGIYCFTFTRHVCFKRVKGRIQ